MALKNVPVLMGGIACLYYLTTTPLKIYSSRSCGTNRSVLLGNDCYLCTLLGNDYHISTIAERSWITRLSASSAKSTMSLSG